MGIQHEEPVPASFGDAFGENYLGSPDVVSRLVGDFCSRVEATIGDLMHGRVDREIFADALNNLVHHYADIFSGRRAPEYKVVNGYHDFSLRYKLMADLGEFWQKQRAKWDDDAVCVLFEWLAVILAEKVKLADGDDMLLEAMLRPSVQYTVSVLLGIEKRAN